jgi:hypothetical protein
LNGTEALELSILLDASPDREWSFLDIEQKKTQTFSHLLWPLVFMVLLSLNSYMLLFFHNLD